MKKQTLFLLAILLCVISLNVGTLQANVNIDEIAYVNADLPIGSRVMEVKNEAILNVFKDPVIFNYSYSAPVLFSTPNTLKNQYIQYRRWPVAKIKGALIRNSKHLLRNPRGRLNQDYLKQVVYTA